MKIIAFEGLDKAGKAIQTKMLKEYLQSLGYKVEASEFHRYDTPTGELIQKWLTKEWDVDQLTIELIMAADKMAQQKWFDELKRNGVDYLILDRYTLSQRVYSLASSPDIDIDFINMLQSKLKQPDLILHIDIPADISMARKGKHNNGENDRYESDHKLLKKVRDLYNQFVDRNSYWAFTVDGQESIEDVHEAVKHIIHNNKF
ncbi:thymidylate kinase [Bacillus phage vB_BauM_KLEB27-3]|nr:thymidylate kinase [Bacillus phage vB_BauM_KLEB27-3]